ncbi:unnamed protein product [Medioppia subpectinata]|uniref:Uncharacterized protein n=1 Tax=Medioppia subpectinata TaxID=1979941 RepID=A0A7R9Q785_9ACAR|nr:unnamed protein product [Medioppia subpectinata]CAG2115472.1 unnamed protein product [Medioppia subpectinata]
MDFSQKYISSLVLWRRPVSTVYYATHELIHQLISLFKWVLRHTKTCLLVTVVIMALLGASYVDGPHQQWVHVFRKQFLWCAYWCGLGILSSVGLGTVAKDTAVWDSTSVGSAAAVIITADTTTHGRDQ